MNDDSILIIYLVGDSFNFYCYLNHYFQIFLTSFAVSMSSSIPCSPVTADFINHSLKSELRPEDSSTDSVQPTIMEDLRSQVFKGQLYKFTNVVKGMLSST